MERVTHFVDVYGHQFVVDREKHSPIAGGQGEVLWTTEPNLLLKIAFAPGSQTEYSRDVEQNKRYMDVRLLPVPLDMNIATPQATLKDYQGYVMTLLDDMEEFEKHFSVHRKIEPTKFIVDYCHGNMDRARELSNYMKQGGIRRRYFAYMKAAVLLARLHANDLVYCDFSPRNIFISSDLNYSAVWIIDSDNLCYSECNDDIVYTPEFCAPEVIAEDSGCTFYSDSYSFAISLFCQLFHCNPFEGKKHAAKIEEIDDRGPADDLLRHGEYGWILDEESDNFDADRTILSYPYVLTEELFRLFQQEFSEMSRLEDETVRPMLAEWAAQLAYAYDNVVHAGGCGMDYMGDRPDFSKCPWDKSSIRTVRICSYYATDTGEKLSNRPLWQFTHEIAGGAVVPLRILHGFHAEEQERNAFLVFCEKGKIIMQSELSFSYEVKFSEDGLYFQSYGRFRMYGSRAYALCHRPANHVGGIREAYILLEVDLQ